MRIPKINRTNIFVHKLVRLTNLPRPPNRQSKMTDRDTSWVVGIVNDELYGKACGYGADNFILSSQARARAFVDARESERKERAPPTAAPAAGNFHPFQPSIKFYYDINSPSSVLTSTE